ncbi:MAG: OsmC family protein [Actinomycetota bacterium]|nr:OsmC family protein [Actinomycetota bacterium]
MNELRFEIELRWSGTGRDGGGEILTDDLALELSAPASMGGRGVGTNPEELLVSAVSSCYTATLFAILDRAKLPVDSLTVDASGTVTSIPGRAQFAGIHVSPTILGGEVTRQSEYEAAAHAAHDRCFIGRALAPEVSYEVGSVQVREAIAPGAGSDEARPPREHADTARESIDERLPAEQAAGASP